jgi:hypothetical protein
MRIKLQYLLISSALFSMNDVYADYDRFAAGIRVQEYWDSNFSRTPEADSEHYTQASLYTTLKYQVSRQALSARVRGVRYTYAQREDLDTDFYDGEASWKSQWGNRLKTEVSWDRMAYLVDRLEFAEQDAVARDDVNAMLTYGTGNRLSFSAGARQTAQTHSNDLREALDFDEEEVFAELAYQASGESTLSLRLRNGEREYPNPLPSEEFRDLDFEYRQAELQGIWNTSSKTSLKVNVGYIDRLGEINAGKGSLASINGSWTITDKIKLTTGYALTRPPLGEASDSPEQEDSVFINIGWRPQERWNLHSGIKYSRQAYQRSEFDEFEVTRDENIYSVTPLAADYHFSKLLSFRFESRWVDRQSSIIARDHSFALASLGVAFQF